MKKEGTIFSCVVVSCSSYRKDKKRDGKEGISTDSWALPWSCSSWRAKQTAFMTLICFDCLTPLVAQSTTSITVLANIQPSPFWCYINISFDLHPSHLQRLQTTPDRDCPSLDVLWYLAKVISTSDCPFWCTYRHHAETPRLGQSWLKASCEQRLSQIFSSAIRQQLVGAQCQFQFALSSFILFLSPCLPQLSKFSSLQSNELCQGPDRQ